MKNPLALISQEITISESEIVKWYFGDRAGNPYSEIGWYQDFYIHIQAKGWANRTGYIGLYWDQNLISSPSIDSIDVAGLQSFDKQGKLSLLLTSSTWQKLAEVVDSDNPKKINLYFEIAGVDTFCKNWRIAKTRKLENNQLIKQYILADSKTANTYLTNKVTVVDKTQVLAYFANQDRLLLKDTIKYGDPLMVVVRVLLSKQDAEKQTEAAFLSRYLII